MKFKAVVFDMDGTLLDTLDDIGCSVNRVLVNNGFPSHNLEKYREFIGDGSRELITRALPMEGRVPDIVSTCLEAYFQDYGENCDVHTKLYDGIAELLDELLQRGLKLAVLSNKRHDLTQICMQHFFSQWHFDVVLGLREGVPRKPNPAGALEISDHLSLPPEKIIYVGDSSTDIQTARAAEMFPVGVGWGFRTIDELKQSGAKAIVAHPLALLDLI